jgi:hypothetical protein
MKINLRVLAVLELFMDPENGEVNVKQECAKQQALRFVIVADVHMGMNMNTRPGEEARELLERLIEMTDSEISPDLLVDLGDRVNNKNHDHDLENATRFSSIMKKLRVQSSYVLGNHDVHFLSKDENSSILNKPLVPRVDILKGYKLIYLDTSQPAIDGIGGNLSDEQLDWLEEQLTEDDLPKIVFGHHPIDDQALEGNPHFVPFPHLAFIRNKKAIQEILQNGSNVVSYINGHVHWLSVNYVGMIPCVSIPSFTEAHPLNKGAPGLFAEVNIVCEREIEVVVRSLKPCRSLGRLYLKHCNSSTSESFEEKKEEDLA